MVSVLGRYSSYAYAIFRIVFGFMFMLHGTQKIFGWPPSGQPGGELAAVMLVGAIIELLGGFMIMVGLFASFAAFLASGTMAVAYFGWHFSMTAFWPIVNRGELAVAYCFAFLYIAARGSGVWSVDGLFRSSSKTNGS